MHSVIFIQMHSVIFIQKLPATFVWDHKIRDWRPRRKTSTHGSVIPKCPDGLSELYYLHEMLHVTRGPCSYADLMTVNGFVYYTFKDAYMAFIFDNNH